MVIIAPMIPVATWDARKDNSFMKSHFSRFFALCLAMTIAGAALFSISWRPVLAQVTETGSNWSGFYWNNQTFTGNPAVTRTDSVINFNWGNGSPDPAIPVDHFSARWYNTIFFGGGTYRFRAGADDGIRVAIDGNKIIDRFTAGGGFVLTTADIPITAGNHQIIVDFYEDAGQAGVLFDWTTISGLPSGAAQSTAIAGTLTPIPTATVITPQTLPVSAIKAVVIATQANVRSGPATTFNPIAQVTLNEVFRVVANNGANTWFLIELKDGRRGWIFRRMIYLYGGDWTKLPVTQTTIVPPPGTATVEGEARMGVLVRSAPSTRADKIGALNQGDTFKVLKLSRNRAWIFVDASGLQGWVFLPNTRIVFGNLGFLPVGN
jgi:uncharacterized protein YgiM (DUF1202 family)